MSSGAQLLSQRNWRYTEKDSLTKALNLMDEQLEALAFPSIQLIYSHHPNEEFLKYSYVKCALQFYDKHDEALKILNQLYNKNPNTNDIHFYLAKANYNVNQFDAAMNYINAFLLRPKISFKLKNKALALKQQIGHAQRLMTLSSYAKVTNLGSAFNSSANQLFPVINLKANQLFFTEGGLPSSKVIHQNMQTAMGSIQISKQSGNEFKTEEVLSEFIKENARVVCLSADAQQLYMIKDNGGQLDIFVSYLLGDKFSKPKKLKGAINSSFNENACSLSPDGKTMFFSSNRGGGYGGYDLYRASLTKDSVWSNIVNLGSSINTSFDEDSPFMHANGQTLFFSSKGMDGMGGFDIFKSHFYQIDSTFFKAENLGFPINSIGDDLGFVLSANSESGFFCSERRGGRGYFDLYAVEPNFKNFKNAVCLVNGQVNINSGTGIAELKIFKADE